MSIVCSIRRGLVGNALNDALQEQSRRLGTTRPSVQRTLTRCGYTSELIMVSKAMDVDSAKQAYPVNQASQLGWSKIFLI